ncbi:MAG: dienelactone hydrolase family protein [Terriglobales bacterium]
MLQVTQSHSTFDSGGQSISYDAFLPQVMNGRRLPAIIGLHGSAGGHATMSDPATMLAAQGFAVYVLHYFDRTGTTGVADKQTAIRHFPLWGKTVWDAITHVERERAVNPQGIGLLGFSLGAYLALSVAAVDQRVKAVVEFFGGFPKEMKFLMRRLCPTLILHGDADPTVPVAEAYHLQQILEKKAIPYEMQIYPGAGHGFTGDIWQDARRRTLAFLQKHLVAE